MLAQVSTLFLCSGTESMSDWRRILRTEDFIALCGERGHLAVRRH